MSRARPPARVLGEFGDADAMLGALDRLRGAKYHQLETYTPFPVPGAVERLGLPRSRLPLVVFAGGAVGLVASYAIQWFANVVDYPIDVGGRPAHAVPAFVLSTFEGTVLAAALTAFFGLFVVLRLPRLWHPVFEVDGFERASVDRFWIAVGGLQSAHDTDTCERVLREGGALRTVRLAEGE